MQKNIGKIDEVLCNRIETIHNFRTHFKLSSEECFWKARVQPSLGHRNTCLSASLASSSPGSYEEIEENSFRLVRGATCLKSPGVKELDIF